MAQLSVMKNLVLIYIYFIVLLIILLDTKKSIIHKLLLFSNDDMLPGFCQVSSNMNCNLISKTWNSWHLTLGKIELPILKTKGSEFFWSFTKQHVYE